MNLLVIFLIFLIITPTINAINVKEKVLENLLTKLKKQKETIEEQDKIIFKQDELIKGKNKEITLYKSKIKNLEDRIDILNKEKKEMKDTYKIALDKSDELKNVYKKENKYLKKENDSFPLKIAAEFALAGYIGGEILDALQ